MSSEPDEKREYKRYEFVSKAKLTFVNRHDQVISKDCEIQDINSSGISLKFTFEGEIYDLNGLPADVCLPLQDHKTCDLQGEIVWLKLDENQPGELFNILCGTKFNEELPSDFLSELLARNVREIWKDIREIFNTAIEGRQKEDPLKILSEEWYRVRATVPELEFVECVFWYYSPRDCFIKNSMNIDLGQRQNGDSYRLKPEGILRKKLMEEDYPVFDSRLIRMEFYSVLSSETYDVDESVLSECLFPLFYNDEFLGLTQFKYQGEIGILEHESKLWLFTRISGCISSVIKSKELKSDNDYSEIIKQITLLVKGSDKRKQLRKIYGEILNKFTDLLGTVPSFLNLFSDTVLINPSDELKFENGFTICAVENLNESYKTNIKNIRSIKSDDIHCCPDSSLKMHEPCFCECDCSPNVNRKMYRVPLLVFDGSEKLIALACFSVSGELDTNNFDPTKKFNRRIQEVSKSLSQYLQNGIQSYIEAQESSLLEKQGWLLTEGRGTEGWGLIVELLKEVNSIMDAKICTFLWRDEDNLNILGTSLYEYFIYDKNGVKRPDMDFDEKFKEFASVSYELNSKYLTSRVAKLKRPISVENITDWQKKTGIIRLMRNAPDEEGAFLGVPIFYSESKGNNDVLGVLRCSAKEKGEYKFFDKNDTKLLFRMGKAITPLLLSIKDIKQNRDRTTSGAHEIRNFTHLFMQNVNREFKQYTQKDISIIAHLMQICTDDIQMQISWDTNKDKTKWPSLHNDIIAPAIGLTNFFMETKYIDKYSSENVRKMGSLSQLNQKLQVDKMRVIQIMSNLLNNAVKYSKNDSSGSYSGEYKGYDKKKVHVVPNKNGHIITIDIINNGYEIKNDEVRKIFNLGYRGTNVKKQALGNGMGLYICKQIIEAACDKHGEGAIKLDLHSSFNPVVFRLVFDLNKLNRRY